MRTTNNAVLKPWANSSSGPLNSQKSSTSSSSIADTSAKFQQEAASQSMADSVQQRAQDDPAAFREALQQAFGGKASPAALDALMSKALSGNLPMPANVQFVDAGTLGPNAMGAYDSANGGTIYLDSRLLNDSQALEAVFTEELGHHLDAELGGQDAAGDEGAIFSDSLLQGKIGDSDLRALKSENDGGFINIENKRIAVEFNGYSGPGSSEATGGSSSSSSSSSSGSSSGGSSGSSSSGGSSSGSSNSSSSSGNSSSSSSGNSSSYSGPGSSSGTGGSDNSSSSGNSSSYSGPGSSSGTGGSDNSSSSGNSSSNSGSGTSGSGNSSSSYNPTSYSGPGSSFETGGSDNFSAATPGSAHSFFSPGSSIGIDAAATTPPPIEGKDDSAVTRSSPGQPPVRDLLERATATGGTTQAARADYVYNPRGSGFERQHDSNQFAQNENTIGLNGGTSEEFRYNNSESQTQQNSNRVQTQIGDSFSVGGFTNPEHDLEKGDDQLGLTANVNAGISNEATAGYSIDGNGIEATVGYNGFVGVQGEIEAHVDYGVVAGNASAEGQAGVLGSADASLTLDYENGFAGQAGVEFFAGAQINLDVGAELGDSVDLAAGVDIKAGIGFEASADIEFGYENVGVDLEIGASLGLGIDLSIDISISPMGVIDDMGDVYSAVRNFIDD